MKTKLLTCLLILGAGVGVTARAQTVQTATPPPGVQAQAQAAPATAPNQTVYAQRLPSVDELSKVAAAQGLAVERVEQSPTQVTVVYKYANGQTNTVAYLLLPGAGATAPTNNVQVVAPTTQAPTVYYAPAPAPAPTVVYYDDYSPRYYSSYAYPYPRYYYPPVTIGLGFGFRSGGYYHGGFHSGGHYRR